VPVGLRSDSEDRHKPAAYIVWWLRLPLDRAARRTSRHGDLGISVRRANVKPRKIVVKGAPSARR
jgi:hypothetical protein